MTKPVSMASLLRIDRNPQHAPLYGASLGSWPQSQEGARRAAFPKHPPARGLVPSPVWFAWVFIQRAHTDQMPDSTDQRLSHTSAWLLGPPTPTVLWLLLLSQR